MIADSRSNNINAKLISSIRMAQSRISQPINTSLQTRSWCKLLQQSLKKKLCYAHHIDCQWPSMVFMTWILKRITIKIVFNFQFFFVCCRFVCCPCTLLLCMRSFHLLTCDCVFCFLFTFHASNRNRLLFEKEIFVFRAPTVCCKSLISRPVNKKRPEKSRVVFIIPEIASTTSRYAFISLNKRPVQRRQII